MPRPLLVANWKLHKTVAEARQFVTDLGLNGAVAQAQGQLDVAIAPPFTALWPLQALSRTVGVQLCAQDIYFEPLGAFTGAVSAPLVAEAGASYVLVGHSERRALFGETGATTQRRLAQACAHGLTPILCVGEHLAEREAGATASVVQNQVEAALQGLSATQVPNLVLAYEPVWAIGTGHRASVAQAEAVHLQLRQVLQGLWGPAKAEQVRLLYGGSVTAEGIAELLAAPHVDGALVGGASLAVASFADLIRRAQGACDDL